MPTPDSVPVQLGVCDILWTPPAGTETDIGSSDGGVTISVTEDFFDVLRNKTGTKKQDKRFQGMNATATVNLEDTVLENLVSVWPGATLINDTVNSKKKVIFDLKVGESMLKYAGKLRLHPSHEDATYMDEDFILTKCIPLPNISQTRTHDGKIVWTFDFELIADGEIIIGDEDATA